MYMYLFSILTKLRIQNDICTIDKFNRLDFWRKLEDDGTPRKKGKQAVKFLFRGFIDIRLSKG